MFVETFDIYAQVDPLRGSETHARNPTMVLIADQSLGSFAKIDSSLEAECVSDHELKRDLLPCRDEDLEQDEWKDDGELLLAILG